MRFIYYEKHVYKTIERDKLFTNIWFLNIY